MPSVLTDNEAIVELAKYAEILENHYGIPQDIEWGVEKNKIYILQSRPSLPSTTARKRSCHEGSGKVLLTGLGAAPGVATGIVRIIASGRELDKVKHGRHHGHQDDHAGYGSGHETSRSHCHR